MTLTTWNNLKILRVAGLVIWALVGISLVIRGLDQSTPARILEVGTLWRLGLTHLAFGLAYWWVAGERISSDWSRILAMVVLTITPAMINYWTTSGIGVLLIIVVAGILPWYSASNTTFLWTITQSFLNLPVFLASGRYSLGEGLFQCGLYLGCSGFIFMVSWIARQQSEGREAMRQINAELRVTQSLALEGERIAERLRISRDLHDLVGHHLTALSLNLEVASHLTEGKAHSHVIQAQQLSRLLLADVREVVSALRRADAIDLTQSVREMVKGVPNPIVHLQLPDNFAVHDPGRAQVILRLTQEILTNTIRHAKARNLWLRFALVDGEIRLDAKDDGCGADEELQAGNGLSGMRERVAQFGGSITIETQAGRGFSLSAGMPMEA